MAPERVDDPTLQQPWQALFDPKSGLRYYWNPVTNVTQYQRPESVAAAVPVPSYQQDYGSVHVKADPHAHLGVAGDYGYDRGANGHSYGHSNGPSSVSQSHHAHIPTQAQPAAHSGPVTPAEYRRQHDLHVQGDNLPDPYQTFEAANFPRDILEEIYRAGFKYPTPIQAQAWPIAVTGRDLVAIAKTGSGKTCGFLLPGLLHIQATRKDPRMGPTLLVLAPTRELAVQTKQEADKFGRTSGIKNTCVYGGAPKSSQLRDLQYGVQIVIATPGRLNDFLESNQVRLGQVSYLVLDEADRMLDMGFEPQIQKIVRTLPARRQTLFFSATWPKEVKQIARQFVNNQTVHVFVGAVEDKLVANKSITQHILMVEQHDKMSELARVLRAKPGNDRIIIFCTTKRTCDQLARNLARDFRAAAIHGDKKQQERDYVLASFKEGRMPILVATDVAARGLDIPHVTAVINFDFPTGVEDYIHRIGRTGRAGATGEAYTFFTSADGKHARELIQVLTDSGQAVPPKLASLAMYSRGGGGGRSRWAAGPSSFPSYGGGSTGFGSSWGAPSIGLPASTVRDRSPVRERSPVRDRDAGRDRDDRKRDSDRGRDRRRSRSRSRSRDRSRRSRSKSRDRSRDRRRRSRSRSRSRDRRDRKRDSPSYGRYSPRR